MVTNQRLLSFLVGQLNRPPEPTATSALCFILDRSAEASRAVVELARVGGPEVPHGLRWVGELAAGGEGRPDLVGLQGSAGGERPRLIIEAKFDARLGGSQMIEYSGRLANCPPSVLMLLAPAHRLPSLWNEALAQLPDGEGQGDHAPPPTADSRDRYEHALLGGHMLMALSWQQLLERIEERVSAAGDGEIGSDVQQLRSLVDIYESQSWVPFIDTDLDLRAARAFTQTMDLFWDLRRGILRAGLKNHGNVSYGHLFIASTHATPLSAKKFQIVRGTDLWVSPALTPLWVTVRPSGALTREALRSALAPLSHDGGPGWVLGEETVRIPLHVPRNCSRDVAVDRLVSDVLRVAELLDRALGDASPGEDIIPSDDEPEQQLDVSDS